MDLKTRRAALEDQLRNQIAAVGNARSELAQLEAGVHQIRGAIGILDELMGAEVAEKGNGVADEHPDV